MLGRLTGTRDVVWGTTVSGRPVDLPSAEAMVGLFINSLPMRAVMAPGESFAALALRLQEQLVSMQPFEFAELGRIRAASGLKGESPLFETLLVFENFPPPVLSHGRGSGLQLADWRFDQMTNFPLVVIVGPSGDRLMLRPGVCRGAVRRRHDRPSRGAFRDAPGRDCGGRVAVGPGPSSARRHPAAASSTGSTPGGGTGRSTRPSTAALAPKPVPIPTASPSWPTRSSSATPHWMRRPGAWRGGSATWASGPTCPSGFAWNVRRR